MVRFKIKRQHAWYCRARYILLVDRESWCWCDAPQATLFPEGLPGGRRGQLWNELERARQRREQKNSGRG